MNDKNFGDAVAFIINFFSLTISISDLKNIISIVNLILVLVFNIIIISIKIKTYLKDGKLDEKEKKDIIDNLNSMKDIINKEDQDNDKN